MYSKFYKYCAVPQCKNTTIKTPQKLFIHVPRTKNERKKWLLLARRDPSLLSTHSKMYFCEDHFDLPNDMDNYIKYRVMGEVSRIRMKPGHLPTKFGCQPDRRRRTDMKTTRSLPAKRQRLETIMEYERELAQAQTKQNVHTTAVHSAPRSASTSWLGLSQLVAIMETKAPETEVINRGPQASHQPHRNYTGCLDLPHVKVESPDNEGTTWGAFYGDDCEETGLNCYVVTAPIKEEVYSEQCTIPDVHSYIKTEPCTEGISEEMEENMFIVYDLSRQVCNETFHLYEINQEADQDCFLQLESQITLDVTKAQDLKIDDVVHMKVETCENAPVLVEKKDTHKRNSDFISKIKSKVNRYPNVGILSARSRNIQPE